jgi:hypothetical protein
MKNYTDEEIQNFIRCPKHIMEPPLKDFKEERGHLRNNMKLESFDGKMRFTVFMRKNEHFRENFSIGIDFNPKDEPGTFCLMRFNGPHGEHVNDILEPNPHFGFHIHEARQEMIDAGYSPEKFAAITDTYASYEEALGAFIKKINIIDADKYFHPEQISLFKDKDMGVNP